MNDIITIKKLAEEIASMTGTDIATAESFLNEFFATVEDALAAGESVKIKGIGSFSRGDSADEPVVFTPEKEFIESVNTPFEMFSAVDIDDSISDEDLANNEDANEDVEEDVEEDIEEDIIVEATADEEETTEIDETDEVDEITEANDDAEAADNSDNSDDSDLSDDSDTPDSNDSSDSYETPDDTPGKKPFIYGLIIGLVVGFACGWISSSYFSKKDTSDNSIIDTATEAINSDKALAGSIAALTQTADSITTDTIAAVIETVAVEEVIPAEIRPKAIVTDTIRPNRFLTTMARLYYGKMDYWAFIYEANADKLGHPNRIKPGTVVVIPSIDEIRRGESDAETLPRAKKLGKEIYARFDR